MPATNQDFTLWCGDSKTLRVTVRDSSRAIVDLTGATVRWWLGKKVTSTGADVLLMKATGGEGIVVTAPTTGLFEVVIDPGDTELLPPGEWYHEAEVIHADGTVVTVTAGRATLMPSLVKAVP